MGRNLQGLQADIGKAPESLISIIILLMYPQWDESNQQTAGHHELGLSFQWQSTAGMGLHNKINQFDGIHGQACMISMPEKSLTRGGGQELFREETKGWFRTRVVLANVPSFRFSFRGTCEYPRSGLRSGGTSECTLAPVFVLGDISQNQPFCKPPFCEPPTITLFQGQLWPDHNRTCGCDLSLGPSQLKPLCKPNF